ncbi:RING-H2 finger protein atl46 [Turnera subulata]|uniref:RING-type E3 ubiquitin transferase n=1 Tax=Turnera subulata TaxID=218843 RepID=A0A9Q0FMA3_9ROSI|nr:RING-H2 finger protein atl46 [Turnera subulata]
MVFRCSQMMPGMLESKENRWLMEHTHLKMSWIQYQMKQKDGILTYPPPLSPSSISPYGGTFHKESPPASSSPPSSPGSRISPAVLFIIVILAVLFFISGLLHLLVRFLIKHPSSSSSSPSRYPEISGSDALQRQLQQLFHLHDSGLDQAFIDALPVFQYKEIVGLKEPFDCAVCLCEFTEKDKLRLLPMCSHAFHINCIDTWLLSNSTCPLCRGTLFTPGFSVENPMYDFDDFRDEDGCAGVNGDNGITSSQKTVEIEEIVVDKGVVPVRLGKFRKVNDGEGETVGETSSSNLDARRCFSMGSYQYVLAKSELKVTLCNEWRGHGIKLAKGTERSGNPSVEGDSEGKKLGRVSKGESFSVSKIWLWPKKGKLPSHSNAPIDLPSSMDTNLPWMGRTQEK